MRCARAAGFSHPVHRTVILGVAFSRAEEGRNGFSQRLGRRRRSDGDRSRSRLRTAQRAVVYHSGCVRARRGGLRRGLPQPRRPEPRSRRLHRACRLPARSGAADSPAARKLIDARARRPAQCLCRRGRRHVQSRCRRAAVAGLFADLTTGKVDVIDPETFKVIDSLAAMPNPEHIVPSWDLQTRGFRRM